MASSSANILVLLGLGLAGIFFMSKKFRKVVKEDFGAFVIKLRLLPPPPPPPPKAPHLLSGLSFAVSDVFDIEGFVTGFGNLEWSKTHEISSRTCDVVSYLVEDGAECVGKTVVDDMGLGIGGENIHYETPTNPAATARVPGGSSSGAAVSVAASLVDFSLGIDTIGGVRIPAAFCNIIGFRASHGAISQLGSVPVSQSLDTVGWFARDPNTLHHVGRVLLQRPFFDNRSPKHIFIADDCFQLLKIPSERTSQVVIKSIEKLFGKNVLEHKNLEHYIDCNIPSLKKLDSGKSNGVMKHSSLKSIAWVARLLQSHEFRQNNQQWIKSANPTLDSIILENVRQSSQVKDLEIEMCKSVKSEMHTALSSLLKDDGLLVIPTVCDPPPKLGSRECSSWRYLERAYGLLGIASISGCCQVTLPLGFHDKLPVSVSFLARHGGDSFLLDTVRRLYASLLEEAELSAKPKVLNNSASPEKSAEIAKEKGNQAFKEKQWQKAIGFYTDAIKHVGDCSTYYSNRAAAYLELGNFVQAEVDCTEAINLNKKNVKAYLRRGTAREMLGSYKEAIQDFRSALVFEPTNKRASISAGRLEKLFK